MSPFSPDTPFNYAPLFVQDQGAAFSLLPMPLVYFAFGLPLVASLITARVGWAVFYGILLGLAAFVHFPHSLTIYGGLLLLSLPVLVAFLWKNDEVRFHKSLPLATCLLIYLMVPLGFPRTVPFELQKCLDNRAVINLAASQLLAREPKSPLSVEMLGLPEIPGCQGPGTSEYVVNANDEVIQVSCLNLAHQVESLGPGSTSYPRRLSEAPQEEGSAPQP